MGRESLSREEHSEAKAWDEGHEDPGGHIGSFLEVDEETHAEDGQEPPNPETRTITACFRDDEPDDHGRGCDGECEGEDGDTGGDGSVVLCYFEVERHVVEESPDG